MILSFARVVAGCRISTSENYDLFKSGIYNMHSKDSLHTDTALFCSILFRRKYQYIQMTYLTSYLIVRLLTLLFESLFHTENQVEVFASDSAHLIRRRNDFISSSKEIGHFILSASHIVTNLMMDTQLHAQNRNVLALCEMRKLGDLFLDKMRTVRREHKLLRRVRTAPVCTKF